LPASALPLGIGMNRSNRPWPSWEWFKNANTWDTKETRTLPAIGRSPLAFLMKRKELKDQFQYVASKLYQAWDTRAEEEKVARELQVQSAGALAEFLDAPDESRL